jgi:hypothetical protein
MAEIDSVLEVLERRVVRAGMSGTGTVQTAPVRTLRSEAFRTAAPQARWRRPELLKAVGRTQMRTARRRHQRDGRAGVGEGLALAVEPAAMDSRINRGSKYPVGSPERVRTRWKNH